MPKHISRLIILLGILVLALISGKIFFTPKSFGAYGHYRAASVTEIADFKPKYKNPSYCQSCHSTQYTAWSTSIHKPVNCQVCHGAAGDHPARGKLPTPTDTVKLCGTCHAETAGRPASQPQIKVADHAGTQQCVACHNPHSPLFTSTGAPISRGKRTATADLAAGKAQAARCESCHGSEGISSIPGFPNLACQKEAYLADALKAYRVGTRSNPAMAGIAKGLRDADIQNVAAYYANLACKK